CRSHLSVLLSQNRGNTGQELVPRSMSFWGEVFGVVGSQGAQDAVGKKLVHPEDVSVQLTEFDQSTSKVIKVLHSFPDGIHDFRAMATKL
ncbi:hypothetical protein N300_06836, partial [Calypte anna]